MFIHSIYSSILDSSFVGVAVNSQKQRILSPLFEAISPLLKAFFNRNRSSSTQGSMLFVHAGGALSLNSISIFHLHNAARRALALIFVAFFAPLFRSSLLTANPVGMQFILLQVGRCPCLCPCTCPCSRYGCLRGRKMSPGSLPPHLNRENDQNGGLTLCMDAEPHHMRAPASTTCGRVSPGLVSLCIFFIPDSLLFCIHFVTIQIV